MEAVLAVPEEQVGGVELVSFPIQRSPKSQAQNLRVICHFAMNVRNINDVAETSERPERNESKFDGSQMTL